MTDRCQRGHKLTAENVSMQIGGSGTATRTCRKCNSERAKLWRKVNAHRLVRKATGHGRPGQTLRAS